MWSEQWCDLSGNIPQCIGLDRQKDQILNTQGLSTGNGIDPRNRRLASTFERPAPFLQGIERRTARQHADVSVAQRQSCAEKPANRTGAQNADAWA